MNAKNVWFKGPPEKPGYYWVRQARTIMPAEIRPCTPIEGQGWVICLPGGYDYHRFDDCELLGPIEPPKPTFALIRKVEHCDGPFWVWECVRYNPDGSETRGFIQATDEYLVAEETFEETAAA